jgi:hypothetical protein
VYARPALRGEFALEHDGASFDGVLLALALKWPAGPVYRVAYVVPIGDAPAVMRECDADLMARVTSDRERGAGFVFMPTGDIARAR